MLSGASFTRYFLYRHCELDWISWRSYVL